MPDAGQRAGRKRIVVERLQRERIMRGGWVDRVFGARGRFDGGWIERLFGGGAATLNKGF